MRVNPRLCHKSGSSFVLISMNANIAINTKVSSVSKTKTLYWTFTLFFVLPFLASGVGFALAAPRVVMNMTHLGYPGYFVRFLGVAKILGAVAVLTGAFPKIKEWAYAGIIFTVLGAFYSHVRSGDGLETLPSVIVLIFASLSYVYWHRHSDAPDSN